MIVPNYFDNYTNLSGYTGKFLTVHGKQDTLFSPEHSKKLFEVCKSKDKHIVIVDSEHNVSDKSIVTFVQKYFVLFV
jgi:fermentation-respiration switch protein FrsA (DUF1100 family)